MRNSILKVGKYNKILFYHPVQQILKETYILDTGKMPEYSYFWNEKQVQVQCPDRTQALGENNKQKLKKTSLYRLSAVSSGERTISREDCA